MARAKKRRPQYGEYGAEEVSARDVERSIRWMRGADKPELLLARKVAMTLTNYRWVHSLTQQQLADTLGMKQPQVARMESGDANPSIETLRRLSDRLGIEFTIEVRRSGVTVDSRIPG